VKVTIRVGGYTSRVTNGGFEAGQVPWAQTTHPVGNLFVAARSDAFAGAWDAQLGGNGYPVTGGLEQPVNIPSSTDFSYQPTGTGNTSVAVSFWAKITTSEPPANGARDVLTVKLVDPATSASITLGTLSNLDSSAVYSQRIYVIPATWHGKQNIRLTFDQSENTGNPTSWAIDEVMLN
jgi:hypothetical protein